MSAAAHRPATPPLRRNSMHAGSSGDSPAVRLEDSWKQCSKPSVNVEGVPLSPIPGMVCHTPVSGCDGDNGQSPKHERDDLSPSRKGKELSKPNSSPTRFPRGSLVATPSRPSFRQQDRRPPILEEDTFVHPGVMQTPTDSPSMPTSQAAIDPGAAGGTTDDALERSAPPGSDNLYVKKALTDCQSPSPIPYGGDVAPPKTPPADLAPRAFNGAVELPSWQTPPPRNFWSNLPVPTPPQAFPLQGATQRAPPFQQPPYIPKIASDPHEMILKLTNNIVTVLATMDNDDDEVRDIIQGAESRIADLRELVLSRPPPLFLHCDRPAVRPLAPAARPQPWAAEEVACLPAALLRDL